MMVICGLPWIQCRQLSRFKALCSASPSEAAEGLRQQLDRLIEEADTTRAKANSSRLRLMRLSEAIEKLRRQAAVSVSRGKENDAREVLFQKKKVMQVMEKLKNRITTLDELSAKLNEAISIKESLLLQNMTLDLDVNEAEAPSPVRIVSPSNTGFIEDQEIQTSVDDLFSHEQSSIQRSWNNSEDSPKLPTYVEFIEHLDQQVKKIEEEIVAFLKLSRILHKNKEFPDTLMATDILQSIRYIKERIAASKEKAQT